MSADEWQAAGTVATFVVATVAAVIALVQLGQARRLREEEARPYVVAFLDRTEANVLDLVVKNFGLTAARDVRLSSSPELYRVWEGKQEPMGTFDVLPVLVPGQEWRTMFDFYDQRGTANDLTTFALTVTSRDSRNKALPTETFVLDEAVYRSVEFMERKGMHEIAEALQTVASQTKSWTEGQRGLSVFTRDGAAKDKRQAERFAAIREARAAQQAADEAALQPPAEPPTDLKPKRTRARKKPPEPSV